MSQAMVRAGEKIIQHHKRIVRLLAGVRSHIDKRLSRAYAKCDFDAALEIVADIPLGVPPYFVEEYLHDFRRQLNKTSFKLNRFSSKILEIKHKHKIVNSVLTKRKE